MIESEAVPGLDVMRRGNGLLVEIGTMSLSITT
jgi:hypothetical protein